MLHANRHWHSILNPEPDYTGLYIDPVGSKFLTCVVVSEIIGILLIRKLANVKV